MDDPRFEAIRNQLLGVRPVLGDEERVFAEQCERYLNEQSEALAAGNYERANALGSLVQNMALLMIAGALLKRT